MYYPKLHAADWPTEYEDVDEIWALWALQNGHEPTIGRYLAEFADKPDDRVVAMINFMLRGRRNEGGWAFEAKRRVGGRPNSSQKQAPDLSALADRLVDARNRSQALAELARRLIGPFKYDDPWVLVMKRPANRVAATRPWKRETATHLARNQPFKVAVRKGLTNVSRWTDYRDRKKLGLGRKGRSRSGKV